MFRKLIPITLVLTLAYSTVFGTCWDTGTTKLQKYYSCRFYKYDNDETGIWVYLDFAKITTIYADNKAIVPNRGHKAGSKKWYVSYPNGLELPLTGSSPLNAYDQYMRFLEDNPEFLNFK